MANVECLEQLKRVVRDAPDDLFDMRSIAERSGGGCRQCAIGWARIDPWFRENTPIRRAVVGLGPLLCVRDAVVADIFGITGRDAWRLFSARAARRLRGRPAKVEFIARVDELIGRERAGDPGGDGEGKA